MTKLVQGGKTLTPAAQTRKIAQCGHMRNPGTSTVEAEVHGEKRDALTGWNRRGVFEARRCSDPVAKTPAKTLDNGNVLQSTQTHMSACIHKVDDLQTGTTSGHGTPGAERCAWIRVELQAKRAPDTGANPGEPRRAEHDPVDINGAVADSIR